MRQFLVEYLGIDTLLSLHIDDGSSQFCHIRVAISLHMMITHGVLSLEGGMPRDQNSSVASLATFDGAFTNFVWPL